MPSAQQSTRPSRRQTLICISLVILFYNYLAAAVLALGSSPTPPLQDSPRHIAVGFGCLAALPVLFLSFDWGVLYGVAAMLSIIGRGAVNRYMSETEEKRKLGCKAGVGERCCAHSLLKRAPLEERWP